MWINSGRGCVAAACLQGLVPLWPGEGSASRHCARKTHLFPSNAAHSGSATRPPRRRSQTLLASSCRSGAQGTRLACTLQPSQHRLPDAHGASWCSRLASPPRVPLPVSNPLATCVPPAHATIATEILTRPPDLLAHVALFCTPDTEQLGTGRGRRQQATNYVIAAVLEEFDGFLGAAWPWTAVFASSSNQPSKRTTNRRCVRIWSIGGLRSRIPPAHIHRNSLGASGGGTCWG